MSPSCAAYRPSPEQGRRCIWRPCALMRWPCMTAAGLWLAGGAPFRPRAACGEGAGRAIPCRRAQSRKPGATPLGPAQRADQALLARVEAATCVPPRQGGARRRLGITAPFRGGKSCSGRTARGGCWALAVSQPFRAGGRKATCPAIRPGCRRPCGQRRRCWRTGDPLCAVCAAPCAVPRRTLACAEGAGLCILRPVRRSGD